MTSKKTPKLQETKPGREGVIRCTSEVRGKQVRYCLRRQYLCFIERDDGAMVQRFLRKAVGREHLRPIEYATGRHVYHLKAKLLYRLIAQPDSQNRR